MFGLGGVAVVYMLAPFLDNLFRKIKKKVLVIICAALLTVFAADCVYSHFVPNVGKGITDYQSSELTTEDVEDITTLSDSQISSAL